MIWVSCSLVQFLSMGIFPNGMYQASSIFAHTNSFSGDISKWQWTLHLVLFVFVCLCFV